jgi:Family of unknown function (DUF5681)
MGWEDAMSQLNGDDYAVGYGKPPASTQYRKGQSGNRTGRPKGANNLKTDLLEELGEKVTLKEGTRTKKVTKQRAMVKTIVAKTLKGESRAATTLIGLLGRVFDLAATEAVASEPLSAEEVEVLEMLAQRMVHNKPSASSTDGEQNDGAKV